MQIPQFMGDMQGQWFMGGAGFFMKPWHYNFNKCIEALSMVSLQACNPASQKMFKNMTLFGGFEH